MQICHLEIKGDLSLTVRWATPFQTLQICSISKSATPMLVLQHPGPKFSGIIHPDACGEALRRNGV